jgi:ribosome-associated protein
MTTPPTTDPTSTAPISGDGRVVEVHSEPVELYKILKFEGMAESGGQAKAVIAEGQVSVNGSVELQKRKKILAGDKIEFNGDRIVIRLSATPETIPEAIPKAKP